MNHEFTAAFLGALCLYVLIAHAIPFCPICSGSEPQTSSAQDPIIAEMISKINESEIYKTAAYLTETVGTRYYGASGNTLAGTYLYNRLGNISGLTVEYQSSLRNVVATLPSNSDQVFIIGAHYDTTSASPGATDNAGGCAIVLELARIMSDYRFDYTIKFAFWNNEEGGSQGSHAFVSEALQTGTSISLYFNYDSACYDPENHYLLDIVYNDQSAWIKDLMTQRNADYNISFSLAYNVHLSCGSDHKPFWNGGYTAVFTHEETHGPAHTPDDTTDKVNLLYAKMNGQIGMSLIAELAIVQEQRSLTDTVPPHVLILSPANKTYSTDSIPLTFVLSEPTSWIGCSIDSQETDTIKGNTILTDLSNGGHTLIVYANDTSGNPAKSDVVCFTVDTASPISLQTEALSLWIIGAVALALASATVAAILLSRRR